MSSIIHQDHLLIQADTATVASFIRQAERILDYYPGGFQKQTFIPHLSFACYGLLGASLLEVEQHSAKKLRLTVYSGLPHWRKIDAEELKQRAFFIMLEDWELQQSDDNHQCHIDKTWHQLTQTRWPWIPRSWLIAVIKLIAKYEHRQLINAWNKAAAKTLA